MLNLEIKIKSFDLSSTILKPSTSISFGFLIDEHATINNIKIKTKKTNSALKTFILFTFFIIIIFEMIFKTISSVN